MQNETNNQLYAIEILCDHLHILLPLDCIGKILSKKDIQQSLEDENCVIYQKRQFLAYSLSNLFQRDNSVKEEYAILIQNEDIEAILYIEGVEEIRLLNNHLYHFPTYLRERNIDYIENCYMSENRHLAYQIDFVKLLKTYHNTRREIYGTK